MYRSRRYAIPYIATVDPTREDTRPWVAYLHGLGCSKEDFIHTMGHPALDGYRHIAFDLPGSGRASYPRGANLTFYDLVEITGAFLESLGIRRASIVGHSTGGIVGLLYASAHPAHVAQFVNIEGTLAPERSRFASECAKRPYTFARFKSEMHPEMLAEIHTAPASPGFKRYLASFNKASARAIYNYRVSHALVTNERSLMAEYLALPMPTLFVVTDDLGYRATSRQLRASGARVVSVSRSRHFPFHDNPEAFVRALAKGLTSLDERASVADSESGYPFEKEQAHAIRHASRR